MTYTALLASNREQSTLVDVLKREPSLLPLKDIMGFYYNTKDSIGIVLHQTDQKDHKRWPSARCLIEFCEYHADYPSQEYLDLYHKLKPLFGEIQWISLVSADNNWVIDEPLELRR